VITAIDQCVNHQQLHKIDFRIIRPDGTARNVNGNGRLQCDELNRPIRLVGSAQDITERTQAAEQLRLSEIKHRTLFDSTHDAVLLWDDRDFFLDCNPLH